MGKLTQRQIEILSCVSASFTEEEIAAHVGLGRAAFQQEMAKLLEVVGSFDEGQRQEVAEQIARHQLQAIQGELRNYRRKRKKKKK